MEKQGWQWRRGLFAGAAALLFAAWLAGCSDKSGDSTSTDEPQSASVRISVLSSAPEYVSGGTTLVDVVVAAGKTGQLSLNGTDVSSKLVADRAVPGHYMALLSDIRDGDNSLVAGDGATSTGLTLTGYPLAGPIISGPHQTPFACQTTLFKLPDGSALGAATDDNCSLPARVDYVYLRTGATDLVAMPVTAGQPITLPADTASVTTTAGITMPFVVRLETRVVDRGIYQSAVLFDPTSEAEPAPWSPPKGWNRRLLVVNGLGCAPGWYVQGSIQGSSTAGGFDFRLLSTIRLGEGNAIYANTLQHGTNNCNPVLVSEASMMSKETFIKTYGVPDFTLSSGCSGGSYGALQPADMIPGLYDGVLVACVFADGLSSSIAGTDARLLAHYFSVTDSTGFTADQRTAITGYKGDAAMMAAALQSNRTDPVPGRVDLSGYSSAQWSSSVAAGLRYDPVANPSGARPTIYDTARNVLGVDAATGFARRPYDNTGVQYGLAALNAGLITTTQFVDLNQQVGGVDNDANYTAARSVGNSDALTLAYRSGLVMNAGAGLASIPIFDTTGTYAEDDNYHQQWQHFALRERLLKANGDTANYVMWRGAPVPAETAWKTFVDWVAAYKADVTAGTQRAKVVRNRPAAAADGCWNGTTFVAESLTLTHTGTSTCSTLMPSWAFPRMAAGGPLASDILKCQLKPIAAADYTVSFTAAELQRLALVFPQGVCDWSKTGVGQVAFVARPSFGPSTVNRVFSLTP